MDIDSFLKPIFEYIKQETGLSIDYSKNVIFSKIAFLVASKKACFIFESDQNKSIMNYYAINLAMSGAGKDFISNELEKKFFYEPIQYIKKQLSNKRSELQKKLEMNAVGIYGNDKFDSNAKNQYIRENSFKELPIKYDKFTIEGFQAVRHQLQESYFGSLFFEQGEILDFFKKENAFELISFLADIYEGRDKAKATKGDLKLKHSENVPVIFMGYSSPTNMHSDSSYKKLSDSFKQYFARRSFFVYENDLIITEYSDVEVHEMVKNKQKNQDLFLNIRQIFKQNFDAIESNKELFISVEMEVKIKIYKNKKQIEAVKNKKNEILYTDLMNRHWKSLKLACILQTIFEPNETHLKNDYWEYASNFADSLEKYIIKFSMDRPIGDFEAIYQFFKDNENQVIPISRVREFIENFKNKSKSAFYSIWNDAKDYIQTKSEQEGFSFEEIIGKRNAKYFCLKTLEKQMEGK